MHELRQVGRSGQPFRDAPAQAPQHRTRTRTLEPDALEHRSRGGPDVDGRVQQTAYAFDVEQGLLQQDQLRLQGQLVAARDLEQLDHDFGQRNFAQGTREVGLANGADRRLEFVHAHVGRHPAGTQVQFGDALVVLPEQGEEILRQPVLVLLGQGAHDAEIERDEARVVAPRGIHPDVAGVRVGVEEVVAEDLCVEQLHALLGELHAIDAGRIEGGEIVDRNAAHALEGEDAGGGVRPDDFGHVEIVRIEEIASQQAGVGAFALQVELVEQGRFDFGDHVERADLVGVGVDPIGQFAERTQQFDIALDARLNIGPQHLDHDFAAIAQFGGMHLGDRGRGQRLLVEGGEASADGGAERAFDGDARLAAGERCDLVLQRGQFVGDVGRQQIATGREDLAELDEDRPELGQGQDQARAARQGRDLGRRARHEQARPTQDAEAVGIVDDVIESITYDDRRDAHHPRQQTPGSGHVRAAAFRRRKRASKRSARSRNSSTSSRNCSISGLAIRSRRSSTR